MTIGQAYTQPCQYDKQLADEFTGELDVVTKVQFLSTDFSFSIGKIRYEKSLYNEINVDPKTVYYRFYVNHSKNTYFINRVYLKSESDVIMINYTGNRFESGSPSKSFEEILDIRQINFLSKNRIDKIRIEYFELEMNRQKTKGIKRIVQKEETNAEFKKNQTDFTSTNPNYFISAFRCLTTIK